MDNQASRASRERAVSPIECSTRPNKRQRTSFSAGSRSRSIDTVKSSHDPPAEVSGIDAQGLPEAEQDSIMTIDSSPDAPKTPESQQGQGQPPQQPNSTKITLNLRTPRHPLERTSDSPISPTKAVAPPPASQENDVKISVEESEADISDILQTITSPRSSTSASPPIEIIDIQPDDEDFDEEPQVTLLPGLGHNILLDPTGQFPYRQDTEVYSESVLKLGQYITTNEEIAPDIREWIDNCLSYTRRVDFRTLQVSLEHYYHLWAALPALIYETTNRKPSVGRGSRLPLDINELHVSFARLTALFVEYDHEILAREASGGGSRCPDLLSHLYITALDEVIRLQMPNQMQNGYIQDGDAHWNKASLLLAAFQAYRPLRNSSAPIESLFRLTQVTIGLLPQFPKLIDTLAGIAELAGFMACGSCRQMQSSRLQSDVDQAKAQLAQGYQFYETLSRALSVCIEKNVNHISPDCALRQINGIASLLLYSLSADHGTTANVLRDHRQKYPNIDPGFTADVMFHDWKLATFTKLIMSSQMQLRVMAVTQMCEDLLRVWQQYGRESPDQHRRREVQRYFTEFLLQTNLVEYILGPTCHPEITTESSNILAFLVVTNTFSDEHKDLMWQTMTTSQDPRIPEALIRMTRSMIHLWNLDGLVYLAQKLYAVPTEEFNPIVREFCQLVFGYMIQKEYKGTLMYGLMFRLLRESSAPGPQFYQDINQFAYKFLPGLLREAHVHKTRPLLYQVCLKDLAEKTPYTLGSLQGICLLTRHDPVLELQKLTLEHNLPRLIVDELENAIASGKDRGLPCVISGTRNSPRTDMLMNIMTHQPTAITGDIGMRLWDMLVGIGAASPEDRDAAWQTLNGVCRRMQLNSFLRTCYNEYLLKLPPECFCSGALEFVLQGILPLVNEVGSIMLDDDDSGDRAGIEQLWRMALTAPNGTIEQKAISVLVKDIYVDSKSIQSFPQHRARKVHLALVRRCLRQLSSAAKTLSASSPDTASGDDETMVITPSHQQIVEQELLFTRSLAVVREFHKIHQETARFSTPDLRSLIPPPQHDVQGDSAELKFQSFDGDVQTEVKPLNIGRRNTAGSLLANLRDATGFDNYRMYYKGQAFVPSEEDICKPLEDLHIHDGIILVKREPEVMHSPIHIRPGASPVEIEIMAHFEVLWQYLSLEEKLAREIYTFLVVLPVHDHVLVTLQEDSATYQDIFPAGQPFKSLYAIHVLREYLNTQYALAKSGQVVEENHPFLRQAMTLIVSAISDREVVDRGCSAELRASLTLRLVELLLQIIRDPSRPESIAECLEETLLDRLLEILSSPLTAEACQNSTKLINVTFQAILDTCSINSRLWNRFCSNERVGEFVQQVLLDDPRASVRKTTARLIAERTTCTLRSSAVPATSFRDFFWPVLFKLVPQAVMRPTACCEVFDLIVGLFMAVREAKSPVLDLCSTIQECGERLLAYSTFEEITHPGDVDPAARGLVSLVHCVLCSEGFPVDLALLPSESFVTKLFWHHLFPRWGSATDRINRPAIILNTPVRAELNDIILKLAGRDLSQVFQLLRDLARLVPFSYDNSEHEPYHYELSFQFERSRAIRSSCGYAGLRNLSNTCYLNSLFTQLFMNVDFRHFMLNVEIRDAEFSQNLLYNTRNLFAQLQDSNRRYIDPVVCVSSIKTYDDTPIDIHNQMDVDEFYNLLFDRWEGQLLSAEAKRNFRQFYGGQLVQQVKSKECEHISERFEPFSAIQCDIKGKTTLQESLQAYVDGEIMEGDNKYKCSTCDRHVDAVKRACLKDIPDNLIFHLKRFDFNLRSLTRSKINDYFSFPDRIDMEPYTIEHLSNPSKDSSEDMFELVGVLVHSGTAESGHYYSYIRERPTTRDAGSWVEFNDDVVTPWCPSQLEAACFGGSDRYPYDANGIVYEKNYSAYMLFYQRSSSLQKAQIIMQETGQISPVHVNMPATLSQSLQAENTTLLRRHCIYDTDHIRLVENVIDQMWKLTDKKCTESHKVEDMAVCMAIGHLDQVASRTKDLPDFERLVSRLQDMCRDCARCSYALYAYFDDNRHEALRMLVQKNPDANVRQESGLLLVQAVREIKESFPDEYQEKLTESDSLGEGVDVDGVDDIIHRIVSMFTTLWETFERNVRSWQEVFGLMLNFVKLGPEEMSAFLQQGFLKKIMLMVYADPSLSLGPSYTRMLNALSRRMVNRPTSYDSIIALIEVMLASLTVEYDGHGHIRTVHRCKDRAELFLRDPSQPMWPTTEEHDILARDWGRGQANIFMDKLIALNQNPTATDSIIACLLDRWTLLLNNKIYLTLRLSITGQIVTHSVSPYLRAAAVYCRMSHNSESIDLLIDYIARECASLENTEGQAFFVFFKDIFDSPRKNSKETKEMIRLQSLRNLPIWAPNLLGCREYDFNLGSEVEAFLHEKLFKYGPSPAFDEANGGIERVRATDRCARQLGHACVGYMQRVFVRPGSHVTHHTVAGLQRVVKLCGRYYEEDEEQGPNSEALTYAKWSQSIFDSINRLTVEELDDDASDWENSIGTSDQVESIGDGDPNDVMDG